METSIQNMSDLSAEDQAYINENISENKAAIHQHALTIENAEKYKKRGQALKRLDSNSDFKDIINEGYFKEEPHRLTMLLATEECKDPIRREDVIRQLDAISFLHSYLVTTDYIGENAEKAILESIEQQEELRRENESYLNGTADIR